MKISKAKALKFLAALGCTNCAFVRNGTNDGTAALFECEHKSAQKVLRSAANGRLELAGYEFRVGPSQPSWSARIHRLHVYATGGKKLIGVIKVTMFAGGSNDPHIEFHNYD